MKFRFETLLRLRKNQENMIQRDMGTINTHLNRQQDSLESLQSITQTSREHYNQSLEKAPDLRMLQLYDGFFQSSKANQSHQSRIISEIEQRAEAKRKELVEAMRKRRTFELLKERHWLQQKKEQRKQETAFLDEIASKRIKGEFL